MTHPHNKMNLKLIACNVMEKELQFAIQDSPHTVEPEFLPMGLHDKGGKKLLTYLSDRIANVKTDSFDAIIIGYALCNNGIAGLCALSTPIVVPRAHDCITLFLGSKKRYLGYFHSNPGVYFQTQGWYTQSDINQSSPIHSNYDTRLSREGLIKKYGEDNGNFLYDELQKQYSNYSQYTYIEMGVEDDQDIELKIRQRATERNWKFEKLQGSLSLFQRLVNGDWGNEDFLIVPPGYRIIPTYDDEIIDIEPCKNEKY